MNLLRNMYRALRKLLGIEQPSRRAKLWNKNVHEKLRYEYELDAHSVVFDLGGYEGQWASDLFARYCPTLYVFEPVRAFAEQITERFAHNPHIHVFPFALGNGTFDTTLSLAANGSSVFIDTPEKETISVKTAADFLAEHQIDHIDLMKINIEGGEYDLLEHLIEHDLTKRISNLQIQFHDFVPNALERMQAIRETLRQTHEPTYLFDFVWENWKLK